MILTLTRRALMGTALAFGLAGVAAAQSFPDRAVTL